MFQDNPNLIKLAPEIYVYKNFLTKEELEHCSKVILSLSEDRWLNNNVYDSTSEIPAPNQVFQGNEGLSFLYDKTTDFFAPEYKPLPSNGISRMIEGQSLEVHWDSPGHPDDHDDYALENFFDQTQNPDNERPLYDPLDTCHIVQYGYVVYVNEFEGGALYYPEQNVTYQPSAGDFVIHSSSKKYRHGVHPVTKGPRYAYTNFVTKSADMPMDLEEYLNRTDEFKEQAIKKQNNAPLWELNKK